MKTFTFLLSALIFCLLMTTSFSKRSGHHHRHRSGHSKPGRKTLNLQSVPKGYRLEHHHHNQTTNAHEWDLMQNAVATFTGCPSIDFSVPVHISTQGPFNLILDTGSTTLAVASTSCSQCDGVSPLLDPNQVGITRTSSSGSISSSYADGSSWSGASMQSSVSVGNSLATPMGFATVDTETNGFISREQCLATPGDPLRNIHQGIIGFAYPELAASGTDAWFSNYVEETNIPNEFYIQLCMTGGNVWIGGFDSSFSSGVFQYVPLTRELYYSLFLHDVQVGGTSAGYGYNTLASCGDGTHHCAVVDSGTTNMVFPSPVYNSVVSMITSSTGFISEFGSVGANPFGSSGTCYSTTSFSSASHLNSVLPPLQFVISYSSSSTDQPLTLRLDALNSYIMTYVLENGDSYYCAGIQDGGSLSVFEGTLMGIAFMNQFIVHHDIANSRLGFAPTARCGIVAPPLPNYLWNTSDWSACSAPCGGGVERRTVTCTDTIGNIAADLLCSESETAPAAEQYCNNQACTSFTSDSLISSIGVGSSSATAGSALSVTWTIIGSSPINVQLVMRQGSGYPIYLARSAISSPYSWQIPSDFTAGSWQIGGYAQNPNNITWGPTVSIAACSSCNQPTCGFSDSYCNNHGGCLDNSTTPQCFCTGGWSGSQCSVAPGVCTQQCSNGGVPNPSTCTCTCPDQYTGAVCDLRYAVYKAVINVPFGAIQVSNRSAISMNFIKDMVYATGAPDESIAIQNFTQESPSQTAIFFTITTRGNNAVLTAYGDQLNTVEGLLSNNIPSNLGSALVLSSAASFSLISLPPEPANNNNNDSNNDNWIQSHTGGFIAIVVIGSVVALVILYCLFCRRTKKVQSTPPSSIQFSSHNHPTQHFVQPQPVQPQYYNQSQYANQQVPYATPQYPQQQYR